jgi:uncharacterized membrane protein (TIGR02234 family)
VIVTGRRELAAAVVGAAVAGALALSSGGQAWATVTAERDAPLPPVTAVLTGSDAAPLVPATGLVLLAAAVALLAVRGIARVAVGLLMAVAGGTLAWSGIRVLAGGVDLSGEEALRRTAQVAVDVSAVWPVLAVAGGVLGAAAGLLAVLRGAGWPAMGRRYERSGAETPAGRARPMTDDDRAQAAWQALDRGEDPTAHDRA